MDSVYCLIKLQIHRLCIIPYIKTSIFARLFLSSLSSTNPLSERRSQTHSQVCLCTKYSTTIYCNQTLCIGRGTWGALCALLPCGEIAVNTFPLLSVSVGSGKQPCSVHYPPLPHWEEHHATFATPHLLPLALQCTRRKWLLFSVYFVFLSAVFHFFVYRSHLVGLGCTKNQEVQEQIGFTACFSLQANYTEVFCEYEIWFLCSCLLLLQNEKCYFTAGSCNQH